MDKFFADTVRSLLRIAPDVFANDLFAMKGGTAINLFVQNMPRLSVDIDVVYIPRQTPREEALSTIQQELAAVEERLTPQGVRTRLIGSKGLSDTKLLVEDETSQVKIEVNTVFHGTALPIERRALCARTTEQFTAELELPVLALDELYGGKLVAALDRQHPRDLFDVWQLYQSGRLTHGMIECFVVYLAGHNRPIHEVLFGRDKNITRNYDSSFVGMTEVPCSLDTLLNTRQRLRQELPAHLTLAHRHFLLGLARGTPDWSLLAIPHAAELPALRWKLANLETFRQRRPAVFAKHIEELETAFARY
ncbi:MULTISPECIES: nucleotidyl transferase AbiEii/AbiGii toxin family protein [Burkholderiaceae]|uniref:nucleotidyl transferase AbiEii/AbiGii toxin family protein n=1 Tax=Burkholderiaceae TaxID=119060 RepID=UPI000964DEA0|nr:MULTISPECIES: nucleotidyl transferase AbiEii/AbiGii toxin family protein [Burkholderiaceae]MCG1018831.1 nucleotidyl transferase AbiEii/AbiGii toxin family protein [Mycetohabitans sp. B4]SIT74720.1 Nucleotidyl transferase AbiEii toxin, Type IV TA system [Burkholderia sp. b13]